MRERVRVGFLGNMNNNHFAAVRFLRDRGIDAELLLFENEIVHFHPSADTYDLNYREFTRQLGWGSSLRLMETSPEAIRSELARYDVLVGCGFAPAYCEKAGRRLDIFASHFGDIIYATIYRLVSPHHLRKFWHAVYYQRRGILRSSVLHLSVNDPLYEEQPFVKRSKSKRWIEPLPMVHSATYAPERLEQMESRTHWAHEFRRLREAHELMVISHARHYWNCPPSDVNTKGTDKLLRGWALFRRENPSVKAVLVTLEYGRDVMHSKALIDQLGIQDSVAWLPMMLRKDVMVGLNMADIVCGMFENNWMTSGVLYEGLVVGKPILTKRDDEYYRRLYPAMYPVLHASDPESIAARLVDFLRDREGARRIGREGREWYQVEVVDRAVDKYHGYILDRAREIGKSA